MWRVAWCGTVALERLGRPCPRHIGPLRTAIDSDRVVTMRDRFKTLLRNVVTHGASFGGGYLFGRVSEKRAARDEGHAAISAAEIAAYLRSGEVKQEMELVSQGAQLLMGVFIASLAESGYEQPALRELGAYRGRSSEVIAEEAVDRALAEAGLAADALTQGARDLYKEHVLAFMVTMWSPFDTIEALEDLDLPDRIDADLSPHVVKACNTHVAKLRDRVPKVFRHIRANLENLEDVLHRWRESGKPDSHTETLAQLIFSFRTA